ncbi:hypothetical protein GU926_02750 [Nibribacter ruber]|uniref:Uncharacterized protein n=1 Tax=Nibribacter ruber TaxID=2698458 RepID=A0A6P1NVY2_9BACT|nr:hypothetical protein [Nibribacter ruber]QHL86419.1 hypothetical protein GU926_02750 [Nibribacter ruber]
MNKNLPTLLALSFFAGIFLLAFSTSNSEVAAYRVIGFICFACAAGLVAIYWNRLRNAFMAKGPSKMDALLKDPAKFSREYGDIYVLADKLKARRQRRHRPTLLHH